MLDRMQRMVERDKNQPSVVMWSLANESWAGENFGAVAAWIRERDPIAAGALRTRPALPQLRLLRLMYPVLEDLERDRPARGATPEGVGAGSR